MRSLSKLFVASLLVLGACLVTPANGPGPAPVGHRVGPAPEPAGPTVISGQVVDSQTHQGLDKVALDFNINNKALGTIVTDATGHFQTPAIEPGEYGVRIRREKYEMIERPGLMVHAGNNEMTFEMVRR